MALLAPKSKVEEWFKDNSWVYQNWVFWYQNPLWTRPVPEMASLCFYFQKACFIRFLFKPFILPFLLMMRVLMGKVAQKSGVKAGEADKWFYTLINKNDDNYTTGRGLHHFAILAVIFVLCSLGLVALAALYFMAVPVMAEEIGRTAHLLYWIMVSGIGILIGTRTYNHIQRDNPDRCRVGWYLAVWAILSVIMLCAFNPGGVMGILAWLWHVICFLAHGFWACLLGIVKGLGWFIATLFTEWIPIALIFLFKWLIYPYGLWWILKGIVLVLAGILFAGILGIPIILWLAGIMVVGHFASKKLELMMIDQKETGTYKVSKSVEYDPYSRNASPDQWDLKIRSMFKLCDLFHYYVSSAIIQNGIRQDDDAKALWNRVHSRTKDQISRRLAEKLYEEMKAERKVPEALHAVPYPIFTILGDSISYGNRVAKNKFGFRKPIERDIYSFAHYLRYGLPEMREHLLKNPRINEEYADEVINACTEYIIEYAHFLSPKVLGEWDPEKYPSHQLVNELENWAVSKWNEKGSKVRKLFNSECKIYAERSDRRKRMDEMCQRFADGACKIFDMTIGNLFRGITFCFVMIGKAIYHGIWKPMVFCWKKTCAIAYWLWNQTSIFCQYMWVLLKAMKAGACPVMKIEHVEGGYQERTSGDIE